MTRRIFSLAEARKRAGHSQESLARQLDVEPSTVGRWERGKTRPQPWIRPQLSQILELTADELAEILCEGSPTPIFKVGIVDDSQQVIEPVSSNERILALNPDDWTRESSNELDSLLRSGMNDPVSHGALMRLMHRWLVVDPPQLTETRTGRHIGEALVFKVEHRVAQLRRLDDYIAGGDLHQLVERELFATSALLRDSAYTESNGRRLLVAIGELCQLAGWVTADAGLHSRSMHYYGIGVKAAEAAGDIPLAANLISTLSYQVSNVGKPSEGVILARTAETGAANKVTSTTHALLLERVAWAHSRAGEKKQAEQALGAVEERYEHRQPDDDPEWVYWLSEDEINVMAGRCYIELGIPERGVPLLAKAIRNYGDETARELALYASWLAEGQILLGNIDEAVTQAKRTLDLSGGIASARSDDRVKLLREKLSPYSGFAPVQEFYDQVRELEYFSALVAKSKHDETR